MKKILIVVFILLLLLGCSNNTNDNKKDDEINNVNSTNENNSDNSNDIDDGTYIVNFYLFHSNSCSHCQEEKAWLKSIEKQYSYLKIHYYEVSENEALYIKVKEVFNITSNGVPLTIIGNDYYLGFSETKERKFIRIIEDTSTKEYCDVIDSIIKNKDYISCMKANEQL